MTIKVRTAESLAAVCAELVKHGVTFEAEELGGYFLITLTGGF